MRREFKLGLALLLVAGCGANPLLKMAAADYSPLRVGSSWTYVRSSGTPAFTTMVLSSSAPGGVGVYQVSNYYPYPGTSAVIATDSIIMVGGTLERKLPYVTGNRWDLPSVGNVSRHRTVDGYEDITTPAGKFSRCFRLKTEIMTYNSVADLTTTTGTFIWSAPNVGDVQYADVDAAGSVSITAALSSYSAGP